LNILSITAGAAGMYCGSCLRDNALAAELARRGHRVTLLPLYTPTLTDEVNVSDRHVFFGGVSVYLEQRLGVFRRTPRWLDWLWDRPALIRALSGRGVETDPRLLGELTLSMLRGEHGHQRKELGKLIDWLATEPAPDVINLPNTLLIALAAPLERALDRPVCCTLQGEDLFIAGLGEPHRSEALRLIGERVADVDAFIAVSEYYAQFMTAYLRIPPARMRTVRLGINLDGFESSPRPARDRFTIGYFARIAPEKGLDRLCRAYRRLRHDGRLPPSRLEAAGYLGAGHRGYLAGIEREMRESGLGDEFAYRGALDRPGKIAFLRTLDVLSVPAPYADPKGLFVLEALACGVPVVQPRHGAFPEIIERTGGGLLVEPNDEAALAQALLSLALDPALAARLSRQGAEGVRTHYAVSAMASDALAVYEELTSKPSRNASHPQEPVPVTHNL
jgi:glycosyltransferase involved in cell wall biosynthesis